MVKVEMDPFKFNLRCFLLIVSGAFTLDSAAQSTVLTNADVLKLRDAGMGDKVILAKIRESPTRFDTSPATLIRLKEQGLSDAVILAMVEAKPLRLPSDDIEPKREFTLKDAVDAKNVLIDSADKASEIELSRGLVAAGFTIVKERRMADLVVNFAIHRSTAPKKNRRPRQ